MAEPSTFAFAEDLSVLNSSSCECGEFEVAFVIQWRWNSRWQDVPAGKDPGILDPTSGRGRWVSGKRPREAVKEAMVFKHSL